MDMSREIVGNEMALDGLNNIFLLIMIVKQSISLTETFIAYV